MKKNLLPVGIVALVFLLWFVFRPGATGTGYATPTECVQEYFQAVKTADATQYLRCLGDDLRDEVKQRFPEPENLAKDLSAIGKDLRNYVLVGEPQIEGNRAEILVDQQFSSGQKRQKIILQKTANSWLISGLEKAQDIPSDVPYGTHISKVP